MRKSGAMQNNINDKRLLGEGMGWTGSGELFNSCWLCFAGPFFNNT